jgi:cytochrome c peroxidase
MTIIRLCRERFSDFQLMKNQGETKMYKFLRAICVFVAVALNRFYLQILHRIVSHRKTLYPVSIAAAGVAGVSLLAGLAGSVQADPPANTSISPSSIQTPNNAPKYFRPAYSSSLASPRPGMKQSDNPPAVFNSQTYANPHGLEGIYQVGGAVTTSSNAFFQSLGTNGRSCFSCHKPDSGMGVSVSSVQTLFQKTNGQDPIFAPVDGANCPNRVPAANTSPAWVGGKFGGGLDTFAGSHSLLLNKGLFRIFLPVPKETNDLSSVGLPPHPTEFTITVVSDPNGCNTDPSYSTYTDPVTQEVSQMISVYRRPRISSNLKFATTPALTLGFGYLPNLDNVTGASVVDPATGLPISGNIMWDGREPTLQSQAQDATLNHAQALTAPTAAQVAQIVAFESNTFAAQASSNIAGDLTGGDGSAVFGGPQAMTTQPFTLGAFADFDAWLAAPNSSLSAKVQKRASIARGQVLYNTRTFTTANVTGFNNGGIMVGAPEPSTCSTCHVAQAGTAILPRNQMTIGTGGQSAQFGGPAPSNDLPIFKVTCHAPYTTPFDGQVVLTNDPGMALITGRCMDVGRKSVPQVRALASRAPYFSDGSAATLRDLVEFYNKRFSINFTEQEKTDLIAFLGAL